MSGRALDCECAAAGPGAGQSRGALYEIRFSYLIHLP